MIKAIIFDFSRVLLNPNKSTYKDSLNALHNKLSVEAGYNPLNHFEFNKELLNFTLQLKSQFPVYIFTTGRIQEDIHLKNILDTIFTKVYSVEDLKIAKDNPEAYKEIAKEINIPTDQLLFIDDTKANIDAAKKAGLKTILFESTSQAIKEITKAIESSN
jgi:FMN phosphatase YigB (HAD superfamily)